MLALTVIMTALAALLSMGSAFQCRIGAASWNSRTASKLLRPVDILSLTKGVKTTFARVALLSVSVPKISLSKNSGLRAIESDSQSGHIDQPKVWRRSTSKTEESADLASGVDGGASSATAGVEPPAWRKETAASIANKAKLELMVQPSKRIVQLEYDHQSSNSINTIKHKWWRKKLPAVSTVPVSKGQRDKGGEARGSHSTQSIEHNGDAYLVDWWHSARKWGLLTDNFLAMLREPHPKTHEHRPDPDNLSPGYIDQPVCTHEFICNAGSTAKNSLPGEENKEHIFADNTASAGETHAAIAEPTQAPSAGGTGSEKSKAPSQSVSVNDEIKDHPLFASFSAIHTEPVMSTVMKEKVAAASALAAKKRQKQQNSARSNQLHKKKRRLLQKAQQKAMQQKALLTQQQRHTQHTQHTITPCTSSKAHGISGTESSNKREQTEAQLEMRLSDRDTSAGEEEAQETVPLAALHALCRRHQARVIAVGDVHGCVDELCDLLRAIIYQPGDQIVLLGDLVAKGPKSAEVVRLAMDLGTLSVRGNHDHEVVRKFYYSSNNVLSEGGGGLTETPRCSSTSLPKLTPRDETEAARPPSINALTDVDKKKKDINSEWFRKLSKHAKIAHLLSPEELAWLGDLPYIIHSEDLKALFVHAGLQRNVSLSDQQPRVVMNMCSELTSGRVSIASLRDFAWAPQWTGPLTAYFGHDTSRGLQQCPWAFGLDTGCVYGGNLTAMLLPEKKLVSVPARKAYVKTHGKGQDDSCE